MAGDNVIQIDAENWQSEVMDSGVTVLVDFWAEWCGPCRAIAPTLEALADELGGKLKVAKVNVDEHQQLATQYNVRSIPTLLVVDQGTVKEQMVGALSKEDLRAKIEPYLH